MLQRAAFIADCMHVILHQLVSTFKWSALSGRASRCVMPELQAVPTARPSFSNSVVVKSTAGVVA